MSYGLRELEPEEEERYADTPLLLSQVRHETPKALFVKLPEGEPVWVPKSQLRMTPASSRTPEQIWISKWWVEKKGLEL